MHILGLNYHEDRSSAVSVHNQRVVGGLLTSSLEFPHSLVTELANPHQSFDYAVTTSNRGLSSFKQLLKPHTKAEAVLVDYREALAMSSIAMRDWSTCAVMVIDPYHCSLGYYADRQFYWLREFSYPNSISLFYSAAAKLLGFDPLTEEYKLTESSIQGLPIYTSLIESRFVNIQEGDYTLLQNLEYGVGSGPLNLDISASVQAVFSKVILSLAAWLAKHVGDTKLAYAGKASANYLTNTMLADSKYFSELSIQPLTSAAGAAIGAAALISRPIWDRIDIGEEVITQISPELLVKKLIKGEIVSYRNNRAEFIDRSTINRNWLAIPFKTTIELFRKTADLTEPWQQPFVICQEKDYKSESLPFGQVMASTLGQYKYNRLVTTNLSTNPFINRVLELLKLEGYNKLISYPIKRTQ